MQEMVTNPAVGTCSDCSNTAASSVSKSVLTAQDLLGMSLPLKIKRPHPMPAEVHCDVISFHHAVKSLLEQPALGDQRPDWYLSSTGTAVPLQAATPKHHLMSACRAHTGLRNGTTQLGKA